MWRSTTFFIIFDNFNFLGKYSTFGIIIFVPRTNFRIALMNLPTDVGTIDSSTLFTDDASFVRTWVADISNGFMQSKQITDILSWLYLRFFEYSVAQLNRLFWCPIEFLFLTFQKEFEKLMTISTM